MSRPAVEVVPGTLWIHECFPLRSGRHVHVSVYLVRGSGGAVAIDSGSFVHREAMRRRVEEAVGPEGLAGVILSHTDYPHSGNVPAFLERWGDLDIVASCSDPEIQGLPYARRSRIGEPLEVAGRTFLFLDPPLADRSHTTWIYDIESEIVFAADGFGNHHPPGECDLLSPSLPSGVRFADMDAFHRESLLWLRWVDPPRLDDALRRMVSERPVRWICPIHGNPLHRDDLDDYLDGMRRMVEWVARAQDRRDGGVPRSGQAPHRKAHY